MSFAHRGGGSGSSNLSPVNNTKEFSLRVPKISEIKYQMMKFNSNLNIDFGKWNHAKMDRDTNVSDGKSVDELMPKFGAGSEFGREARQEAKKKRYGGNKKISESNPWLLKIGGKKFKGVREGGISDNSSYYIFTHGEDNVINAHKLDEWYNFQPIQRYKTLTAEEAEMEFGRRNKVMNHFTLMLQKRLKNEKDDDDDEDDKPKLSIRKTKELKISEMEEWDVSEDDTEDEEGEAEEEIQKKKKKKEQNQIKPKPNKKKLKGSDGSAIEDSDDGDEEGRELDYISDSSDNVSNDDNTGTDMKGVSEEKGLKSLLTSDEDEEEEKEEEENKKKQQLNETDNNADLDEDQNKKEENKSKSVLTNKKKKKSLDKKAKKDTDTDSDSSTFSSDIDSEPIKKRPFSLDVMKSNYSSDQMGFSNDSFNLSSEPTHKKARLEFSPLSLSDTHGITEELVRRYLSRKPITTTELVSKFKNRSNLSSEQLVSIIALLLKKINPEKKMIKNKMYLSLKHA